MRIAFIWSKGGPKAWDWRNLETGLGGSEAMMVLYAQEFARQGHEVSCYVSESARTIDRKHDIAWGPLDDLLKWSGDVAVAVRDPRILGCVPVETPVRALLANDQACADLPPAVEDGSCNLVIAISEYQAALYVGLYSLSEDQIYVSSAGVEWEAFDPAPEKEPWCLYMSTPERGLKHLMTLWPLIHQINPEARLFVTGGFELYGWPPELAHRGAGAIYPFLRVLPNCEYTGPIPRSELISLINKSSVMLYPSTYDENCCIAALEAAAGGMAIVTSARAALNERVIHEVTGYLVEGTPGEGEEYERYFCAYASRLLVDKGLCRRMGDDARKWAQLYSYETLCGQMARHFQKLISK